MVSSPVQVSGQDVIGYALSGQFGWFAGFLVDEMQSSAGEAKDGFVEFLVTLPRHVIVQHLVDAQIGIWAVKHDLSH